MSRVQSCRNCGSEVNPHWQRCRKCDIPLGETTGFFNRIEYDWFTSERLPRGRFFLYTVVCIWIPLLNLICLANEVPRRLHDVGKSGNYAWFILLPFANLVLLLILIVWPGERGTNEYGPPNV